MDQKDELGVCHLGIQIGSKIVHWFNCSLAIIKDWRGKNATILFPPQNKQGEEVYYIYNTKKNR